MRIHNLARWKNNNFPNIYPESDRILSGASFDHSPKPDKPLRSSLQKLRTLNNRVIPRYREKGSHTDFKERSWKQEAEVPSTKDEPDEEGDDNEALPVMATRGPLYPRGNWRPRRMKGRDERQQLDLIPGLAERRSTPSWSRHVTSGILRFRRTTGRWELDPTVAMSPEEISPSWGFLNRAIYIEPGLIWCSSTHTDNLLVASLFIFLYGRVNGRA